MLKLVVFARVQEIRLDQAVETMLRLTDSPTFDH
jgi:hypothetical protein